MKTELANIKTDIAGIETDIIGIKADIAYINTEIVDTNQKLDRRLSNIEFFLFRGKKRFLRVYSARRPIPIELMIIV